jgi:hypothetical protein
MPALNHTQLKRELSSKSKFCAVQIKLLILGENLATAGNSLSDSSSKLLVNFTAI